MPVTKSLTAIQRRFLQEYIKDYNGVKAYMRACPNVDYDSAKNTAYVILKKPEAHKYLDQLEKEKFQELRINAEHIATELAKIAFMDDTASQKDRMKAIELLQKQLGLQQQKITADVSTNINIDIGEIDEH